MPRYWVMAPDKSNSELFEKVWHFDLAGNTISIGWQQLGDISQMPREELAAAVGSSYPDKPLPTRSLFTNMLWNFYHEMMPGDYVIARKGRKTLAGVGRVVGPARFMPGRNPDVQHSGFLDVTWQAEPTNKAFAKIVFPMHTLAELSEEEFHGVVEGSGSSVLTPEPLLEVEDHSEFVLEKYLEDFIVNNFRVIFDGSLSIYEDAEGNNGQQYATDIGPIDILAVDSRTRDFVVIELKKGRPSDHVIGQVLRYMGWVKKNLCSQRQAVRGLVICRDADPKLTYALETLTNVGVRYYSVSFTLKEGA